MSPSEADTETLDANRLLDAFEFEQLTQARPLTDPSAQSSHERLVLITGGAGFIGINLAKALIARGRRVLIYDDLANPGSRQNLRWLMQQCGRSFDLNMAGMDDTAALESALKQAETVYHLAGQTSMNRSFVEPLLDFEQNALATVRLLQALRSMDNPPTLVYVTTAKVYGALHGLELEEIETRYIPCEHRIRLFGLSEEYPLLFDSPFSCSTGTADRYVLEFSNSFNIHTVILRVGTVYGPGDTAAGMNWVTNMMRAAVNAEPVTIFGNGKQVRDLLFIDDAVRALLVAENHMPLLESSAFNVGGGCTNSISLLEYIHHLGQWGYITQPQFQPSSKGDQRYYVSDFRKFSGLTGWKPLWNIDQGLARVREWLARPQPYDMWDESNGGTTTIC